MLLGMLGEYFQTSFILNLSTCCLSHQSVEILFFWYNILTFILTLFPVICKVSCQEPAFLSPYPLLVTLWSRTEALMLLANVPAVFLSPLTFTFLTVTLEKQCIIFEGHLLSQIQSSMYMNKKPIFFHSLCLSVHSSLTTRYKRNVLERDSFLHGLTSAAYHIRTKKNCSSHPNKREYSSCISCAREKLQGKS